MNVRFVTVAALLMLGHAALAASPQQNPAQPSDKPSVRQQFGSGVRVAEVDADSAAASAGIKSGDVILAINGKPINSRLDIDPLVEASGKRPLAIEIDRAGAHLRLKVTPRLSSEPAAQGSVQRKLLGISIANADR